jgi:hypothetical protein
MSGIAKRKAPRVAKVKDRRPDGECAHHREQRIERARLLELQAERPVHHAAETRDAAP